MVDEPIATEDLGTNSDDGDGGTADRTSISLHSQEEVAMGVPVTGVFSKSRCTDTVKWFEPTPPEKLKVWWKHWVVLNCSKRPKLFT